MEDFWAQLPGQKELFSMRSAYRLLVNTRWIVKPLDNRADPSNAEADVNGWTSLWKISVLGNFRFFCGDLLDNLYQLRIFDTTGTWVRWEVVHSTEWKTHGAILWPVVQCRRVCGHCLMTILLDTWVLTINQTQNSGFSRCMPLFPMVNLQGWWSCYGRFRRHRGRWFMSLVFRARRPLISLSSHMYRISRFLQNLTLQPRELCRTLLFNGRLLQMVWKKINVDGGVNGSEWGAVGAIFRHKNEVYLGALAVVIPGLTNPGPLKAITCMETLALGEDLSLRWTHVASDCKVVVDEISGGFLGRYGAIVREIQLRKPNFESAIFVHKLKNYNFKPHNLA